MGTCYSFGIAVGIELPFKQVVKKYGRKLPEKSHLEDRYDPRTGRKLKPEKVVDRQAGLVVTIGGKDIDPESDPDAVIEELKKLLGADVLRVNDNPDGVDESHVLLVQPDDYSLDDVSTECLDYGRVDADGGYRIDQLAGLLPKLEAIAARLRKLGFKPSRPMVRVVGGFG